MTVQFLSQLVRRFASTKCGLAGLCLALLVQGTAYAAGLGALALHSSLGQHLDAEIAITAADGIDPNKIQAYMASNEVYSQLGIVKAPVLQHLRFNVQPGSGQGPVIKLTSTQPIREPFVNFIVELSWPQGTFLREYTFLLDPVLSHRSSLAKAIVQQSSAAPDMEAAEAAPAATTNLEYIVRRGDSLLDIASRYAAAPISKEQMAVALYRRNPHAFFGSVNKLKRGARLVIPDTAGAPFLSQAAALRQLRLKPPSPTTPSSTAEAVNEPANAVNAKVAEQSEQSDALSSEETAVVPNPVDSVNAVVSQSAGLERPELSVSASALMRLIAELRQSMTSLGQELDVKTTQLNDISVRVDQLQQRQAVAVDAEGNVLGALVPSVSAMKTESLASATSSSAVADNGLTVSDTSTDPLNPRTTVDALAESTGNEDAIAIVKSAAELEQAVPNQNGNEAETDNSDAELVSTDVTQDSDALSETEPVLESETNSTATISAVSEEAAIVANRPQYIDKSKTSWFFDKERNQRIANQVKNAGFILLAVVLSSLLFQKWHGRRRLNEVDLNASDAATNNINDTNNTVSQSKERPGVVNPLSAIEYFREQLSGEQRMEHDLKDSLEQQPDRQDIRLELLRVYHRRGAQEMFAATARDMYEATAGKNAEWHEVIEMGLSLDSDMRFYEEPADSPFELDEQFAVSGETISSVSGGKSPSTSPYNERVLKDTVSPLSRRQTSSDSYNTTSEQGVDFLADESGIDIELDYINNGDAPAVTITGLRSDATDEFALDKVEWHSTRAPSAAANDASQLDKFTEQAPDINISDAATDDDRHTETAAEKPLGNLPDTKGSGLTSISDPPLVDETKLGNGDDDFQLPDGAFDTNVEDALIDPDELAEHAAPSKWKECEVRLDLAVVYIDMGNTDGAVVLLKEVIENGDAAQTTVAQGLLKKL